MGSFISSIGSAKDTTKMKASEIVLQQFRQLGVWSLIILVRNAACLLIQNRYLYYSVKRWRAIEPIMQSRILQPVLVIN